MTKMHCGMCEHDWNARSATPKRCPSCRSDEIETAEQALITKACNARAQLDPFARALYDSALDRCVADPPLTKAA